MMGDFSTLKQEAPLFQYLANPIQCPSWWKELTTKENIYIEIRKDNYINVYYRGGNIAKIEWKKGHLVATAHQKYLGDQKPIRTRKNKKGGIENVYEYRDCIEWLNSNLDNLLENVEKCYSNKKTTSAEITENSCEKFIQGYLITHDKKSFLDSEFAYNLDPQLPNLRIDLIHCDNNGELTFIELKRIQDGRLYKTNKEPEIKTQMNTYKTFINTYAPCIINYYKQVYHIKKALGIPTVQQEPQSVNPKPTLLIADIYKDKNTKRNKRENNIDEVVNSIKGINVKKFSI